MLSPAQVIPFLEHEDKKVRTHAAHYLSDAHDPSPATADDFWRAIDRFGLGEAPLTGNLFRMPQTEQSYGRLVATLRALPEGDKSHPGYYLWYVLATLDWPLLVEHRDEVLAFDKAPPYVRRHLADRLALQNVPLDELWNRLLRRAEEEDKKNEADDEEDEEAEEDEEGEDDAEDEDESEEDDEIREEDDDGGEGNVDDEEDEEDEDEDYPESERYRPLIEALARDFPREAGERALDQLVNGPGEDWMELYCVELLGEAGYRQAVPVLLDQMLSDDDELMQTVNEALVKLGDADVVRRIEEFSRGKSTDVRIFLDDPLGKIKLPESEAALLRMIRAELDRRPPNHEVLTSLVSELLDLCPSPEALEVVRGIVVKKQYDAWMDALDERLLTVASMVGYTFPEADRWRKKIAERDAERDRRNAMLDEMMKQPGGQEKVLRTLFSELAARGGGAYASEPGPELQPARLPEPSEALTPIRRSSPKVGRNDPCPCGSGKKYKKCCMTKDEAG